MTTTTTQTNSDPGVAFTSANTAMVWPRTGETVPDTVTRARREVMRPGRATLILLRRPRTIPERRAA